MGLNPAAVAQLRAYNLAAIASGLEAVAAEWARLFIDRLPVRARTLEILQAEYRDLMESLPVAAPEELAAVLHRYVRGLRLHEGRVTVSQRQHLRSALGLGLPGPRTDTFQYVALLGRDPQSRARGLSEASLLYVISHRHLGVLFPICTEEFRDHLAASAVHRDLVDARGAVLLDPLIAVHSCWLARVIEGQQGARATPER